MTGRERDRTVAAADRPRKVVVIGGGPAGMEAAIVAARRGHEVTLFEGEAVPGGRLPVAAVPPYKGRLSLLNDYFRTQLHKTGVDVHTCAPVTAADVAGLAPDAVVVATGGTPRLPEIPGLATARAVMAEAVLAGTAATGERIVVIGGELVGCETAEFLAAAGKAVTITRRGPAMAAALAEDIREPLLARLATQGVTMLTGVAYEAATTDGLHITARDGARRFLPADTIVLAAGAEPTTELFEALRNIVPDVRRIGDCLAPRSLLEAIAEGFEAGRTL